MDVARTQGCTLGGALPSRWDEEMTKKSAINPPARKSGRSPVNYFPTFCWTRTTTPCDNYETETEPEDPAATNDSSEHSKPKQAEADNEKKPDQKRKRKTMTQNRNNPRVKVSVPLISVPLISKISKRKAWPQRYADMRTQADL